MSAEHARAGASVGVGVDVKRVAEVIVTRGNRQGWRGSGYRVTDAAVLTTAHVVRAAAEIHVRFDADHPAEWSAPATVTWSDDGVDVAILAIPPGTGPPVATASYGRLPDHDTVVSATALGFPRFKLRNDLAPPPRGLAFQYRDLEHAVGRLPVWSNRREGTLELRVDPPEKDPDPKRSPWEGMSGAAVWAGGRIVGVVNEHHLSDGLGRLSGTRVDRWYGRLSPGRLRELCALVGLPDQVTKLKTVGEPKAQRQTRASRPAPIRISMQLPQTGRDLFGRAKELRVLDTAWSDPNTNILSIVAWGGVGKSALINTWMSTMAQRRWHRAKRVFAWSFYRQGTSDEAVSADLFIEKALTWFGDPQPKLGSPWDKGDRLADLVRQERTLLVLDGVEPLQFPPGPQEGKLKDQTMSALLVSLAASNSGLCVVSTRLKVMDIDPFEGTARLIELKYLSPKAGAELLKSLGVKTGTNAELEQASTEFGGHALALTLLGSYLNDACDGDIRRRAEVGPLQEDVRHGGHARRVMASYEDWFGEGPELAVLRLLGLFDRPADSGALDALRSPPAIANLTEALQSSHEFEWGRLIGKLRRARLIADADPSQGGTLDAHPLVREYFGQQLRQRDPLSWRQGHKRLYQHLTETAKDQPDTIEEMTPVFTAIVHACEAGLYNEALELYQSRVLRGEDYFSTYRLGAFGNEIAVLYHFFEPSWKAPVPELSESQKAFVLRHTGYCQRALGLLKQAAKWMEKALSVYERLGDWKKCLEVSGQLSYIDLNLGSLDKALEHGMRSVHLADAHSYPYDQWVNRTKLGDALHNAGRLMEATAAFVEAEEILQSERGDWLLYGVSGFKYCDLLVTQGHSLEAKRRAFWMRQWVKDNPGDPSATKLTTALANLCLASIELIESESEELDGHRSLQEVERYLKLAFEYLRVRQDWLARGLLTRAELYRARNDLNGPITI